MRVIFKTLVFTLLVPGSVTVAVPHFLLTSRPELVRFELGPFRLLGILPMALGASFYLLCAWDFAWTGKGTPAPIDPPQFLVSNGLYLRVRNPMYIGVGLVLLGESLFFESSALLVYALVLGSTFHLFVVFYEEPHLKRKFGARYEAYLKTVPRWIPRR